MNFGRIAIPEGTVPDAGHATYPGDVRSIVGEIKGPVANGLIVAAVTADYDLETNRTRVGFGYVRQAKR